VNSPSRGVDVRLQIGSLWQRGYGVLVRDFTWTSPPGHLTVLTGATPASRWAVAALLADALPAERFAFTGSLTIDGRGSALAHRSLVALAEAWRVRSADTEPGRRLAALRWAERSERPFVVLSPGIENLDTPDSLTVVTAAQQLAAAGTTVLLTANNTSQLPDLPTHAGNITVARLDNSRRDVAA